MVDPSKDQFYQQQLAPWSHLGGASPYGSHHPLPATHQSHMYGGPPRLNHSFPGLVPEAPSPAPPPPHTAPTTSTSHHGAAAHPYYPMHLAALSAAAVAASDFSRPLPAHSPATAGHSSSGGASAAASAPLPAHLSRNPYQNYHHHAYMPSYYGNHHTPPPMSQPAVASRDANGYNPPPSSYAAIGSSKDLHSANVYNLSKNREPQHQATSDDRNGYKTTTDRRGASSQFQPFPASYPGPAGLPHNTAATPTVPSTQSHSGYHYPFDMSKLGYQFGHQQPPQSHVPPGGVHNHHHPQQQHPQPPSAHPPPHPAQLPPSSSSLAHSAGATAKGDKGRSSNGINSSSAQSSQDHPVQQATNLGGPPKPNFSSHYLDQLATHPSIKQLLPQKPHPPAAAVAPTAAGNTSSTTATTPLSAPLLPATTTSHDHVKPTTPSTTASTSVSGPTSSVIGGALSVPNSNPTTHHQNKLAKTYEVSTNKSHLQTAIENSDMSPHPTIRDTTNESSKRKASIDNTTTSIKVGASLPCSTEPPPKRTKLVNHDVDPYNFDEEDSIGNISTTKPAIVDSNGVVESTRFGCSSSSSAIKSESPASSPGGSSYSVYKFKSALLSRNSCGNNGGSTGNLQDLPKLSSKSVPLTFENLGQTNMFIEACDRFMEDLNSKPMSVSKRASVESFVAAQAARAAIKAGKKAEKEQQKVQAAERKAEREDRKEKERLGLIPPKSKKRSRKSSNNNKNQDPDQPPQEGAEEECIAAADDGNDDFAGRNHEMKEKESSSDNMTLADQIPKDHHSQPTTPPVVSATATNNNNSNSSSLQPLKVEEKPPKKGGTWALPIVPKMPQKPQGENKRKGLAPLPNIPMPTKTKKSEGRPKSSSSSTKTSAPTSNSLTSSGGGGGRSGNAKAGGGLANVWLQAFGAKPTVTKTPKQEPVESKEKLREVKVTKKTYLDIPPELRRRPKPKFGGLIHFSPDWERAVQKYHEKARMPETLVDGIKVKPNILQSSSGVNPSTTTPTPVSCSTISSSAITESLVDNNTKEDGNKYAALSSYLGSPTHSSDPGSPPPPPPLLVSTSSHPSCNPPSKLYPYLMAKGSSSEGRNEVHDGIANVVDRILEQRKILRQSMGFGRMYKVPFEKKKKTRVLDLFDQADSGIKLMKTPGIPDIDEDVSEETFISSYNNFRKQTLIRYLDETVNHSPELKAKILDWKPEVLENKTRHQTTKARETTAYKEIFGCEPGTKKKGKSKSKKKPKKVVVDDDDAAASTLLSSDMESPVNDKSENKNKVQQTTTTTPTDPISKAVQQEKSSSSSNKRTNNNKKSKKNSTNLDAGGNKKTAVDQVQQQQQHPLPHPHNCPPGSPAGLNDEDYIPNKSEEQLQTELQTYALDLLEHNLSWEKRTVIQNLVIWEPVTDPALLAVPPNVTVPGTVPGLAGSVNNLQSPSRKKAKKVRKRQSGLDFSRKKSSSSGKNSRDVSRAHSPALGGSGGGAHDDQLAGEVKEVVHSLANVLSDSKHLVTDKSTGETILHRAAKMGYPDVAAYALDMAKMSATVKDNAGWTAIHKAALKGHAEVVDYLIRYGADPNTNVKGTRPLHEALEQGHIQAVINLLKHGSDPLLYDYSGNMPIDLAQESEDADLLEYFSAILNDLHGKPAVRWNVTHDRQFMLPQTEDLDLPKLDDDDESDNDFEFEVSSQPLPPQFTFTRYPDEKFVQVAELKKSFGIDMKQLGKVQSNLVIKMPREEFIKTAYCCLLGSSIDPGKADPVVMVAVTDGLNKILGINSSKLFNNLPSSVKKTSTSPSSKKSKSSH